MSLRVFVFPIVLACSPQVTRERSFAPRRAQNSIAQLEAKLKSQYAKIEKLIASPPSRRQYPLEADLKRSLREWQDNLAQSFAAAADTVADILKLQPPNPESWQERFETLQLYSQPVSPPETRQVFGAGEVERSANILGMPAAVYPDEARVADADGQVRLRLVLAADKTVRFVFPIRSASHGMTEAAMSAARRIRFEPAQRNGMPASEFFTVVYEFKHGEARPPYIPKTIF
ncbi:MAG TPA: TonB family protein [Pyrinomonadaceae bacterium]|nr:TonB family protein [Pyrinomonadaceae bacterium]